MHEDELINFWILIQLNAELAIKSISYNRLSGYSSEGTHSIALQRVSYEIDLFIKRELLASASNSSKERLHPGNHLSLGK